MRIPDMRTTHCKTDSRPHDCNAELCHLKNMYQNISGAVCQLGPLEAICTPGTCMIRVQNAAAMHVGSVSFKPCVVTALQKGCRTA